MNIPFNNFGNSTYNAKRQKFGFLSLVLLLFIGGLFTGIGIVMLNSMRINPDWSKTTGVIADSSSHISDGSTTYAPVIKYEVSGINYRVTSSISTSSYPSIGEKREVAYNPIRPDQAKVIESASSQWFLYLFPITGIFFMVLGPYLFVRSLKRSNAINNLIQRGQKLQGVLVEVKSEGTNNDSYKIVVAATDTNGTVQNYISDSLEGIGGLAMADFRVNPIPIDVYVDPTNPSNYYVDVSEIPNLTPSRIKDLLQTASGKSEAGSTNNLPPTSSL